ncbi:MAG TPA: ribbon-helix-helix domain-containing protein [Anaerolineales bacterium]|nr:ribbon-helix-helix domain-containing protein [Anaerolineales bacterium]
MVRIMVQLTEEQLKALKELAKARKTSVAKLVREGVDQYIVTAPKELTYEEKRQRALEFIQQIKEGKFQAHDIEGKTDVSVNHDKYLAEIYGTWKKSS